MKAFEKPLGAFLKASEQVFFEVYPDRAGAQTEGRKAGRQECGKAGRREAGRAGSQESRWMAGKLGVKAGRRELKREGWGKAWEGARGFGKVWQDLGKRGKARGGHVRHI